MPNSDILYLIKGSVLDDIANAVRRKTNKTALIPSDNIASEIDSIKSYEGKFKKTTGSVKINSKATVDIEVTKNCVIHGYCTSESLPTPFILLVNNGTLVELSILIITEFAFSLSGTTLKCTNNSSGNFTYGYDLYTIA